VANQVQVYYARDLDTGDRFLGAAVEANSADSQALPMGVVRETVDAEWIRDAVTANALGRVLCDEGAYPKTAMLFDTTVAGCAVETGDTLGIEDVTAQPNAAMAARVLGVSQPEPHVTRISAVFSGLLALSYTTIWESGAHSIRLYPSIQKMVFFIAGAPVAYMDGNGTWFAKGGFVRTPELYSGITNNGAAIAYSSDYGGSLCFGTLNSAGTTYWRAFVIDATGNLRARGLTTGLLRTEKTLASLIDAETDHEYLYFGFDTTAYLSRVSIFQHILPPNPPFPGQEIDAGIAVFALRTNQPM
jgi:hypothetical protein